MPGTAYGDFGLLGFSSIPTALKSLSNSITPYLFGLLTLKAKINPPFKSFRDKISFSKFPPKKKLSPKIKVTFEFPINSSPTINASARPLGKFCDS